MDNMSKIWIAYNNFSLSKMLFFNFCLLFSQISNGYCQKILRKNHPFSYCISRVLMKVYYVTNIFDLYTFHNETTTFLKFFEIYTEMDFVSLFFLNEKNITTSLLMIHLKHTVVHYANLNSSSINKPYLRAVEYAISFFSISYISLF